MDQEDLIKANLPSKDEKERTKAQLIVEWFTTFFVKNFLPIILIFAVIFGAFIPAPGVFFNHKATVYVCISILFLYIGLYLQTSAIKDAIQAYKAYIWGCLSILAVTCIIGGQLTKLLNFDTLVVNKPPMTNGSLMNVSMGEDLAAPSNTLGPFECKIGLIMYLIMPCTVGTGVIMITGMKANVALGILITVICNIVAIFTIPLYLKWLVYSDVDAKFDIGDMMLKLFLTLFIPLAVGKVLRFNKRIRTFIDVPSRKTKFKMFALSALAFILLVSVSQSSYDGGLKRITGLVAVIICTWSLAMHIVFLILNTLMSFLLKLPLDQKKCIIIIASQKTLTQAVAATVFLPDGVGDQGLIAVTMVFCHITILVFDSVLIPTWIYLEEWYEKRKSIEKKGKIFRQP